jgi:SNF2 family DNA or RNA helicase
VRILEACGPAALVLHQKAMDAFKGRLIAPYQHDGVKWMVQREQSKDYSGGFLCDEMGLGKTVQTIATMLTNGGKTLIICPRSVVPQWKAEIKRFSNLTTCIWDRQTPNFRDYDVVITTYAMIIPAGDRDTTALHGAKWDRVVLDEAHEIRNKATKTFKSSVRLKAASRWLLTGTPVFNSMSDFVSLCIFMGAEKGDVQRNYDFFRNTMVLRRTKESVCQFNERLRLPDCDFQNLELEMHPEEKELYTGVFSEAQDKVKEILKTAPANMQVMYILEQMLRCRQLMIWPQMYLDGIAAKDGSEPDLWEGRSKKLETLIECIKEHPTEKALVFCQFMGEMDRIYELLYDLNIFTYRIDGSVSKELREQQIERFKRRATGCVLLIQIKAGGVGLNLQEATRVYITAPSWNPATELQAIGRAHRTGQTQKVYVKKLLYVDENSIEESIMTLQNHKAVVCAEVLNDPKFAEQLPTKLKAPMNVRALGRIFSRG